LFFGIIAGCIADRPARAWPIWLESQVLAGSDLSPSDHFGTSVAVDHDTAVVSTFRWEDDGGRGYAYIYHKTLSQTWDQVAKLSPVGVAAHGFGKSVAISGRDVIVGGPTGAAYIFSGDGSGHWNEAGKLIPDAILAESRFGHAVDIHGQIAIVGDPRYGSAGGAAYVFRKNQTGEWPQVAKLVPEDVPATSHFGNSVAVFGKTAIVGATGFGEPGAAYIFREDEHQHWRQIAKLTGGNGPIGYFGQSVDIDTGMVIVGSYQSGQRAAYIFREGIDGIWSETFRFVTTGSLYEDSDKLVAIDGNTAILGAPVNDSASVFVFRNENGTWAQTEQLIPNSRTINFFRYGSYGSAVALHSGVLIVGDYYSDLASPGGGAAYIFNAIPEPSTAAMVLISIIGVVSFCWRGRIRPARSGC
jgi:hypothetical protein